MAVPSQACSLSSDDDVEQGRINLHDEIPKGRRFRLRASCFVLISIIIRFITTSLAIAIFLTYYSDGFRIGVFYYWIVLVLVICSDLNACSRHILADMPLSEGFLQSRCSEQGVLVLSSVLGSYSAYPNAGAEPDIDNINHLPYVLNVIMSVLLLVNQLLCCVGRPAIEDFRRSRFIDWK